MTLALRPDANGYAPAPVSRIDGVREMAEMVAKSRLFPGVATTEAAFTLMMLCEAEGLHPMDAVRRYHIIEGRPSMRADAMLATFQAKGGRVQWLRTDGEACEAAFSHPELHPEPVVVSMTLKRFMENGVAMSFKDRTPALKDNWRKFPDAMLRARVTSAGVRMIMPGVVAGIYTPEEVEDFAREERAQLPPPAPAQGRLAPPPRPKAEPSLYQEFVRERCLSFAERTGVKVQPKQVNRALITMFKRDGLIDHHLDDAEAFAEVRRLYVKDPGGVAEDVAGYLETLLPEPADPSPPFDPTTGDDTRPLSAAIAEELGVASRAFTEAFPDAPDPIRRTLPNSFSIERHMIKWAEACGLGGPATTKPSDVKAWLDSEGAGDHASAFRAEVHGYIDAKLGQAMAEAKNDRDGDPDDEPEPGSNG